MKKKKKKKKEKKKKRKKKVPEFVMKFVLFFTILVLQFHSWSTLDTCLCCIEITSHHLGVSSSFSEAGMSLRIMLCLLGTEILL